MQQLAGLDPSFVYVESPRAPMHLTPVMIYDPSSAPGGPVTFERIVKTFKDRLHLARAFRQRLVRVPFDLDHPYWIEDPDFDLEHHVHRTILPAPGDWRQFCDEVAALHARPLDLRRPPWEMTMIEGLDGVDGMAPGCFGVVLKIHHSAIDGMARVELLTAIHDSEADAPPPAQPERMWSPDREPSAIELLGRAVVNNTTKPFHFAQVMRHNMPTVRGLPRPRGAPRAAPRTRFNGSITAHRVFDSRRFPLSVVRSITSAVPDATVNDVVLAIVGGALRSWLSALGELPDRTLTSNVPISVRTPEDGAAGGNHVSMMLVPLATDIPDPLERLVAIRDSSHRAKQFAKAVGARTLTELSQLAPGTLIGLGARTSARVQLLGRGPMPVNTTVTNTPGPTKPLYLAGAKCVYIGGAAPINDGLGLIHSVSSYDGNLLIGFAACREMVPDPGGYADCISASLDDLRTATGTTD